MPSGPQMGSNLLVPQPQPLLHWSFRRASLSAASHDSLEADLTGTPGQVRSGQAWLTGGRPDRYTRSGQVRSGQGKSGLA